MNITDKQWRELYNPAETGPGDPKPVAHRARRQTLREQGWQATAVSDTERNPRYPHSPYPKTCALMEELGIEVNIIAENDFDTTGYWELVYDEEGKRVLNANGDAKAIRRQWPSPAVALRVVDQFVKERLEGMKR